MTKIIKIIRHKAPGGTVTIGRPSSPVFKRKA